jgi:hypothetical protein
MEVSGLKKFSFFVVKVLKVPAKSRLSLCLYLKYKKYYTEGRLDNAFGNCKRIIGQCP